MSPNRYGLPTFGEMVAFYRKKKGLSLRALAKQLGCSAAFLSDIERGNRLTTKIPELARALGIGEATLRSKIPTCPHCGQRMSLKMVLPRQ